MRRPTERQRGAGFTIVEVLVAIALFAIVVLVVVAPLTGLFGLTQKSTQQVGATNSAQQALERIRGQWLAQSNYDQGCVDALPAGVTVSIQNEDVQGSAVGAPGNVIRSADCGSDASVAGPPLRRVTVVATSGASASTSTLVVEVARP